MRFFAHVKWWRSMGSICIHSNAITHRHFTPQEETSSPRNRIGSNKFPQEPKHLVLRCPRRLPSQLLCLHPASPQRHLWNRGVTQRCQANHNIVKNKPSKVGFREAECYKINPENKKVYCKPTSQLTNVDNGNEEFSFDYDYLVVAMGARANTFNTPGMVENCYFLKEIEDAQMIRRTVIDCFERVNLLSARSRGSRFCTLWSLVAGRLVWSVLLSSMILFDKRITEFAEDKFKRDGIDLKTGSMVTQVTDKEIFTKERATGETKSSPYGLVVWSTGIGTRPVVTEFMKQIGQVNRCAIVTDEWLRVRALIAFMLWEDIAEIFNKADKEKRGKLNLKDFKALVEDICERYPHVEIYMKKKQVKNIIKLLKTNTESNGDKQASEIDIEQFKVALAEVDSQKNLPATAQVAAQQGAYLANCFNRMEECEKNPEGPIRIRGTGRRPSNHSGGEQTAAQLPGNSVSIGHSSQWLCTLVSWHTRMLVVSDWARRLIFGRDLSRI
ncbi:External alternative NAD(P)H-ubiquinone oxidoreductase B3, mitochondrial-like protein [Drosera capensis]